MSSVNMSNEQLFNKKLKEMGLRVKYSESERFQYGVAIYRLEIRIFKGHEKLGYTTGGYWCKSAYRESAFIQGIRRLNELQKKFDSLERTSKSN